MNRIAILLVLAAAGCKIKNNASLVITKVVAGTAVTTGAGGGAACTFNPGDVETDFLGYNPTENTGTLGVVVQNAILPSTNVNPALRTDAETFLAHQAVIDYEIVGQGAVGGERIVPVDGAVPTGGTAPVIVPLLPAGAVPATVAPGSIIRTTFHIEGKLVDGSSVHTSEREYLWVVCASTGCAGNVCL
ncbi:MAG: hypothetical protein LC689_11390 [Myxococcales bacterium]|nr:hypothetical protein [Myxococcales bacterium]